ncbi:hypothetical protein QTP88_012732 [Uroleucon formosanum]
MSSNSSNSSTMWKYFDKCDNGGSCKLCRMTVKTCGNTTNLKQHLKRKHPSININVSARKSARSESDPTPFENDEDDPSMVQSTSGTQTTLDTVVVSHSRPTSQCSGYETVLSKGSELSDSISEVSVASNFTVGTSTSRSSSSSCSKQSKLMQPTIAQSFNDIRSFEKGGVKSVSITNSIVYMLVKDNMPFWSTEKDGFKYFMKTVAPMYKIPSRKTITKLISTKYDVLAVQIKNKLSLVENITLTTDIWTDTINTKSYLGMTGHYLNLSKLQLDSVMLGVLELQERHTSENIIGWLDNLLKKWGIEKNQDKHLPCFAHTLNLVVQNALDDTNDIANIINQIKRLVTFFKHSVAATDELHKICKFKLKQSVPTRWNSVYFMLQRFIACSDNIASTIVKFPNSPPMISGAQLFVAKEIMILLKPFEAATKELCGQNYVTASKVIPLLHCLIKKIEPIEINNVISIDFKNNLLKNLKTRFGRVEYLEILSIATILDPRFKTLHSNDPIASSKAIGSIKKKIIDIQIECSESSSSNAGNSSDDENPDNLWSVHNELVSKKAVNAIMYSNEMPTDLKHYLNQPTLSLGDDILKFWNTHGPIYPNLKKNVEPYLAMVATSVPSERLFSKAGQIVTDCRNRLTGKNLNQIMFLGSLTEKDWHLDLI